MRHPEAWYVSLARDLGHPGYVTLSEVHRAERAPVPARDSKGSLRPSQGHREASLRTP